MSFSKVKMNNPLFITFLFSLIITLSSSEAVVIGDFNVTLSGNISFSENIESFKIGLLAPWTGIYKDFSGLTSASAVSIALENIQADPTLGPKMQFR